jgi:hypothetical protein
MYAKDSKERAASFFSVGQALTPTNAQSFSSWFCLSYISTAFEPRDFLYTLKTEAAVLPETSIAFHKSEQRYFQEDPNFSV